MKLKPLINFIRAREQLRTRREDNQTPWTKDPILSRFHFCNIDREHDRITKWVDANVRTKYKMPDLLTQLVASRIFNDPDVLADILPIRTEAGLYRALIRRQRQGLKIFRGAYMMTTSGVSIPSALAFSRVVGRVKAARVPNTDRLEDVASFLQTFRGIGPFLANQVCTDLRYIPGGRYRWVDWRTFVLAGPGTRRGLNRLHGRPVRQGQTQKSVYKELMALREYLHEEFGEVFNDPNNVANSLCEFDKYQRAKDQIAAGEPMRLKRIFQPYNPTP